MSNKILFAILGNLILGNIIIYFHEIYGRNQTEVASYLWISFSLVSITVLLLSTLSLRTQRSALFALMLSLVVSFLIPVIGFFCSMEFSVVSALIGAVYLYYGFFMLVFPMFVLNFLLFRWIQKS